MAEIDAATGKSIHVTGIVLIVLGALAILAPLQSGVAVGVIVGAILALAGVAHLLRWWKQPEGNERKIELTRGGLLAIVGFLLVIGTEFFLGLLGIFLIVFFILDGAARIGAAREMKPREGWGWAMTEGVVSLLLAVCLLADWPVSGVWAFGILVGVRLILAGMGMVVIGRALKEA